MTTPKMKQVDVSKHYGAQKPDAQLQALAESVNMLQGANDQDQRAVRVFEMNNTIDAINAKLAALGQTPIPKI